MKKFTKKQKIIAVVIIISIIIIGSFYVYKDYELKEKKKRIRDLPSKSSYDPSIPASPGVFWGGVSNGSEGIVPDATGDEEESYLEKLFNF